MTSYLAKNMIYSSGGLHLRYLYCQTLALILFMLALAPKRTLVATPQQQLFKDHHRMRSHDIISIHGEDSPFGYITSPGYPNSAPFGDVAIVALRITDESGEADAILLTFEEMSLQTANNCEGEALNIYHIEQNDNALDPSRLIYSLCGSLPLEPILVFSRNIVLQYVSDDFVMNGLRRFKVKFEFINSQVDLHNQCELPNHFKCRNRKCISNELLCDGFDDCGDASDEDRWTPCFELPSIPYTTKYKCGRASFGDSLVERHEQRSDSNGATLANRIIGGSRAIVEKRALPQVSIQLIGIEPISHQCGGSLIHPLFVLTSAHCFKEELEPSNHKLLFGLQDLRRPQESQVQVRYAFRVSSYPTHGFRLPEFALNEFERANNLALVELNAPVHINSHVGPACLPHLGETITAGLECVYTGFGETRGSGLTFNLKQLKQSITHSSECRSGFSDFKVDDYNMICIKNRNSSGPCRGDSGGPLLCRNDDNDLRTPVNVSKPEMRPVEANDQFREPGDILDFLTFDDEDGEYYDHSDYGSHRRRRGQSRYTIYGVTSFTTDGNFGGGYCGHEDSPTIYARVSNRIEWILSVLRLALPRMSKDDRLQDGTDRPSVFGYMFRSGFSQHANFTRPMTLNAG